VEKNTTKDSGIRSVQRALNILQCFDWDNKELTFSEIVDKISLPKSTTSRILSTLENEGFLIRDPDTMKYKLGHSIYLLGIVAKESLDIRSISLPFMEKMTKLTNETSNLYLLENYDRVCIAQVPSPMPIKQTVQVGERFPIWAGATGRSILAFLDESVWDEMIKELKQFTDKTVVDPDEFINDLREIRRKGYSVSMGEKFVEIGCVAAPIFNANRVIGCISISGPVYRFPKDTTSYTNLVTEAAQSISHKLGYRIKRSAFLE
jgi:DNA-binding IclR family transcriptional regulator